MFVCVCVCVCMCMFICMCMCMCMCTCKEDSGVEKSDECKCWDQRLLMEKAVDGVKASHHFR